MVAFTVGALLPLLAITLSPLSVRVWVTVATVAVALAVAGFIQARLGYESRGTRGRPQRRRRAAGDGGHVRRGIGRRHARLSSALMRAFVAVVPPPEVVEHLDAFLDVRRRPRRTAGLRRSSST